MYGKSGSEPPMRPMPSKLDVLVGNSEHDTQYKNIKLYTP